MQSHPISVTASELIARQLAVIGQPVRVRLIDNLGRGGELSVSELAGAVGVSIHDASQHLAVLLRAGVTERRREGRRMLYRLAASSPAIGIFDLVTTELDEQLRDRARRLA